MVGPFKPPLTPPPLPTLAKSPSLSYFFKPSLMVDHYHIQECIIVQLAIACPSGGLWWSQEVSPHQCREDPVFCKVGGKTNKFGYPTLTS